MMIKFHKTPLKCKYRIDQPSIILSQEHKLPLSKQQK